MKTLRNKLGIGSHGSKKLNACDWIEIGISFHEYHLLQYSTLVLAHSTQWFCSYFIAHHVSLCFIHKKYVSIWNFRTEVNDMCSVFARVISSVSALNNIWSKWRANSTGLFWWNAKRKRFWTEAPTVWTTCRKVARRARHLWLLQIPMLKSTLVFSRKIK